MRKGFLSVVGSSLRNATTAAPPIPYSSRSAGSTGVSAGFFNRPTGMEAQMRAQGSNGTLFAITDRIITSYSQVEWRLYRKAKSGMKEDRREVTAHAALDLWNNPNPFMVGTQFRETTQQHEELTGEQWWICSKHPASPMPLELWPVRPDRIRPVTDPVKYIVGYEYIGPDDEVVPLGLDEVIPQRRPNPLDPFRGLGPVQTILTDLDSSRYSREWNRRFFINSAEPGGVLQVEKRLSDDEFNELRARWSEQHKGTTGAHRVAILENGLTWVDRSFSNRDMQFTELLAASRETIREAFGFPKPLLGATDDVNRANAEAAEVVFARWLIVPRLQRTKAILNHRLLPMFGTAATRLEFDYDTPVPDDLEAEAAQLTAKANAAGVLRDAGWAPDDILATVGLPEMRYIGAPAAPVPTEDSVEDDTFENLAARLVGEPEAAMRWVAVCVDDANSCQPCLDNDGQTYRNRAAAYEDYPGGKGYVNCLGGENCRCTVVKRGKDGVGE